jgi:hypothetical protein
MMTAAVPPAEPLSPELILVSPPEVAQAARKLLPEPGYFAGIGTAAPQVESRLRQLLVLAAVYAACLLVTVPPLAFVAFASPSIR